MTGLSAPTPTADLVVQAAVAAALAVPPPPLGVVSSTWTAWWVGRTLIDSEAFMIQRSVRGAKIGERVALGLQAVLGPPWQRHFVYAAIALTRAYPDPVDLPRGVPFKAFRSATNQMITAAVWAPQPWKWQQHPRCDNLIRIADALGATSRGYIAPPQLPPPPLWAKGIMVLDILSPTRVDAPPAECWIGLNCGSLKGDLADWLGGAGLRETIAKGVSRRPISGPSCSRWGLIVDLSRGPLPTFEPIGCKALPSWFPKSQGLVDAIAKRWPVAMGGGIMPPV